MVVVSKFFLYIFSSFLSLAFTAMIIFGIIGAVKVDVFIALGVGIIVFGVIGLITSFTGCCGAGYEKDNAEKGSMRMKGFFLITYFSIICIVHIVLLMFGVAFLTMSSSVKLIGSFPSNEIEPIERSLGYVNNLEGAVKLIKKLMIGFGSCFVGIGIIILVSIFVAVYRMGFDLFAKFFVITASVIQLIIGLILAIFLLAENSNVVKYIQELPKGVYETIIVGGFILAAIGIFGFVSTCLGNRLKFITAIYNIFNIVIFISFIGLLVFTIIFRVNIRNIVDTYCEGTGKDDCKERKEHMIENFDYCSDVSCDEYKSEFINASTTWAGACVILLVFFFSYLIVFLAFLIIATFINICRRPLDSEDEGQYNRFPEYSYY